MSKCSQNVSISLLMSSRVVSSAQDLLRDMDVLPEVRTEDPVPRGVVRNGTELVERWHHAGVRNEEVDAPNLIAAWAVQF